MPNRQPCELDDFLFDLNGFLVLKNAVAPDLLAALHGTFDAFPDDLPMGGWLGGAQRRDYTPDTGLELHQAVTLGGPFATLIDHPSWIDLVRHYGGEEKSYVEGLFIDESIASVRTQGGHHPVHAGGYRVALRGTYGYNNGVFRCGQINIILAVSDIGPGDGPTMVVPASHKSNFDHPGKAAYEKRERMDELVGAVPVHMEAGDALLFVDGLMHGGSRRTNPGERRITIYRYGPIWGASRYGYQYDPAFLDTLTPTQRRILQPLPPIFPGGAGVHQGFAGKEY